MTKEQCEVNCTEAVEDLRESEQRFRLVFDYAPIGMAITDLAGKFTRVNHALCNLLGLTENEFTGLYLRDIMSQDELARLKAAVEPLVNEQEQRAMLEMHFRRTDGITIHVMVHMALVRGRNNQPLYYIGQIVDITERKRYEEAIRYMAYHDPLTKLPNRMLFRDRLTLALAQAKANEEKLAVVFLDLDRFKEINDTLGHYVGDKALQIIASRISESLRKSDVVARLGGDEFTLLLPGIPSKENARLVVDKIVKAIEQPLLLDGRQFIVSTSVGIALFPEDAAGVDALLQVADKNMYQDKQRKGIEM